TSERILLGRHGSVNPRCVLGDWQYRRTSNPESNCLNKKQQEEGFNEPTATVMWNTLSRHNLSTMEVVLWNIFPFHPYKKTGILTNRTPAKEELDRGIVYAKMLITLIPGMKIIAIGQKSANTLQAYGVDCSAVPHPSMGGANRFKEAVARLFAET
ncbi:MAG: uracil-DNA glycosylase, partial [Acidaminococcaceae bacterium]